MGETWWEYGANIRSMLNGIWLECGATWKRYERYFEWNMEELSVAYRWSMDEV